MQCKSEMGLETMAWIEYLNREKFILKGIRGWIWEHKTLNQLLLNFLTKPSQKLSLTNILESLAEICNS